MAYRDDLEALKIRHDALARELDDLRNKRRELEQAAARQTELEREVAEVAREMSEMQQKRQLPLLEDIRIASPCNERWDEMLGDGRSRHCLKCDKNVYDVSAMTREEAEALIRSNEGGVCLRLYKRRDGRVITSDCPVGVRRRRVTRVAALVALGGAAAGAMALHAEATRCQNSGGPGVDVSFWDEHVVMGELEPPAMGSVAPVTPPAPDGE